MVGCRGGRRSILALPYSGLVTRGTFSPKGEKIRSLSTASAIAASAIAASAIAASAIAASATAVGSTGRDAVLYFTTLTSPIGALARTLLIELVSGACDQDTAGSPSVGVAGDGAGADRGESGLCVEVERPLCC